MRARTHEIRVPDPPRARPRAEGKDVEEAVAEAEDRAFGEVEAGGPGLGVVGGFVEDGGLEGGEGDACASGYGGED